MIAKDKANEIGNRFYQGHAFDYSKAGHLEEIERAKERSKICVQYIIDAVKDGKSFEDWNKVMAEIDKL